MTRLIFCLAIVVPLSNLNSQEIVSVEEVKPHTRLLVKRADGAVLITRLEHISSPGSFDSPSSLQFLSNPNLLKETTLSDSQKKQLQELQEDYQKESKKLVAEFNDSIAKTDDRGEKLNLAKEMMEKIGSLQRNAANKIEMELIPFQSTIIKKYKFKQMSYMGFHKAILKDPFVSDLKLSKKQKEEINQVSQQTEKEIKELIEKAREKAKSKITKILNAEQKAYVKELSENRP